MSLGFATTLATPQLAAERQASLPLPLPRPTLSLSTVPSAGDMPPAAGVTRV
jgi:hypothetical protein